MKRQTILGAVVAMTLAACQGGEQATVSENQEQMEQREATVPAQTALLVSLDEEVNSRTHRAGDVFRTTLSEPVLVGNQVVLSAGTAVMGELGTVQHPEDGGVIMELHLTRLDLPGGDDEDIRTRDLRLLGETGSVEDDLEKVALGGVAGGILGAVVGGSKGAAIGAAAGASAGTVVAVVTRKDGEIVVPAGQRMRFVLAENATIPQPRIS
jgi:hypothetical protein